MEPISHRMLLAIVLIEGALHAQSGRKVRFCTDVVAQLPASPDDEQSPVSQRARFELRRCLDGNIRVYCYRRNETAASVKFDTFDDWPVQLVHVGNVLLLVSRGASAKHVSVFEFEAGEPRVALETGTKADTIIRVENGRLRVNVPEPVGTEAPPRVFRDRWHAFPSSQ